MKKNFRYLAYDAGNNEYQSFETIEEAHKYLESCFFDDGAYDPDLDQYEVYELVEVVRHDILDSKENYKYIYEEDVPEDDEESEVWPYDSAYDEIWQHKFVPVKF